MPLNKNRKICYSFKEYESKYYNSLQEYLDIHVDFHEIYFIEQEREFYAKCHASADITTSVNSEDVKEYKINNGNLKNLITDIIEKIQNSSLDNGFDFELSNKYKSTFRKIVNFLDEKLIEVKLNYSKINPSIELPIADNDPILVNPYPRIFKNASAFSFFDRLKDEFGDTKENLANYSFIYHKMLKDNLIYDDFKQVDFTFFLLEFNIKIDRIKCYSDIGKKKLRESIYSNAK